MLDPLGAEIVSKSVGFYHGDDSPFHGTRDSMVVNLSSATSEEEKVSSHGSFLESGYEGGNPKSSRTTFL